MITIIDYKSGNLRSISNGFRKIGYEAKITSDPEEIANAELLVLPGVGAFGTAMKNIEPFKHVIKEYIYEDKPFLGICLGLHVLLSASDEAPGVKGLDCFKGHVEKIPEGRKIPHMGWNQLKLKKDCSILKGLDNEFFYFVHSYHAVLDDELAIAGTSDYGLDITAALSLNNLFATQFHPEKSGVPGLKILKNFVNLKE